MNAVSVIPNFEPAQTMSSREIAELVDSRHDKVKQSIERLAERGVIGLPPLGEYLDSLGRKAAEYRIGKRDSYVIVAQLSPEFTARLVDRWQELEAQNKIDPMLALSDPATLRMLLTNYSEKVVELEAKVETDAPKVAFAESVAVAPDAIDLASAAKILGTGRNRLSAKLKQIGWLTRFNEPYQDKINQGLLDVKIRQWNHPDMGLQRSVTALVTGKGLLKLQSMLKPHPALN